MANIAKAFALRDNPFKPILPLGLNNIASQNSLETKPLLIHSEPRLNDLFSRDAGPFGTYIDNFKTHAGDLGFTDNPPGAGTQSQVFSIFGYEGTGKSTFAQAIITWLEKCTPPASIWHVRDEWSRTKEKDSEQQKQRIAAEQAALDNVAGQNSYCCIVVDNLVAGAMDAAVQWFEYLIQNRVVFMFLISSDDELYPRLAGGGRFPITPFRMRPLSENDAVAFVRDRIELFRVPPAQRPTWLPAHSLFPFDENDIRSAFARGVLLQKMDAVALRDFNVMANQMLINKLKSLDNNFDITTKTEAEAIAHIISLSDEYNQLMAA